GLLRLSANEPDYAGLVLIAQTVELCDDSLEHLHVVIGIRRLLTVDVPAKQHDGAHQVLVHGGPSFRGTRSAGRPPTTSSGRAPSAAPGPRRASRSGSPRARQPCS